MSNLWIVIIAFAAVLSIWLFGGALGIAYLSTHPPRRRPRRPPPPFGDAFEDVAFPSRDGVALAGWFVPTQKSAPKGAVVLCHGMNANRDEALDWAEPLGQEGFALLLFDFRAGGHSEGDLCSAGYQERLDLLGAMDYIAARPETARLPVGVFGFSMGGATAILTAAEDERIRAVATHGAYASLDRAIRRRCRLHFGPFAPLAQKTTVRIGALMNWFPHSTDLVSPIESVSRLAPRPLLLLHGENDRIIEARDAVDLYEAAGHPKALHLLPRSGHRDIHLPLRDETQERLVAFFRDNLKQVTGSR